MSIEDTEVHHSVDARGSACPGPILEAKKGIAKVKKGQVLEVLASDEGTRSDLPVWVKRVKHEYIGIIEGEGYFKMLIRRMK